jgi:hypothetical protein
MDIDKKRFGLGMGLAWVPILVMGPGVASAFRGISQQKATGLAAVAGGFMEFFVMFGFMAFVACEVAGIVFLARGIRRERLGAVDGGGGVDCGELTDSDLDGFNDVVVLAFATVVSCG